MSDVQYPIDVANLTTGACPGTLQELADTLGALYSVTVSTNNTGIVVSTTKPADTTVVWKQLDASTLRPVRDYIYVGGYWLSRHPQLPGSIMIWDQALPDFSTFDGGDANALSPIGGPMWEEVTELRAKVPIGAGTLTSGTVLAVTDTGGEETHVLTTPELPATINLNALLPGHRTNEEAGGPQWLAPLGSSGASLTTPATESGIFNFTNTGGGQGHNTLPPYYTVYFLRRTIKEFYVVP